MEKSNPTAAVDPVCGMKVDRSTARFKTAYAGREYFFCCAGCMKKFQADPQGVLAAPPKPMGGGFVSLGMVGTPKPPSLPQGAGPLAPSHSSTQHAGVSAANRDTRKYVCPMCPEVSSIGPAPCPKCGMALEPESPSQAPTKTEYTCPMHPEVVRSEPGSCPICGMALEPRSVTLEEENSELRDMTRRFWIGVALTAPVARDCHGEHDLAAGYSWRARLFIGLGERRCGDLGVRWSHGLSSFSLLLSCSGVAGHSFSADGPRS